MICHAWLAPMCPPLALINADRQGCAGSPARDLLSLSMSSVASAFQARGQPGVFSGFSTIGANASAKSNEVRLVSTTARWLMGAGSGNFLFIGSNSAANRLVISNGATASVNANAYLGYISESASNNQALVTGSNSVWSSAGTIEVGFLGSGNQVVVSNGGVVLANNVVLGDGTIASNNLAVVTGAGSGIGQTAARLEMSHDASADTALLERLARAVYARLP